MNGVRLVVWLVLVALVVTPVLVLASPAPGDAAGGVAKRHTLRHHPRVGTAWRNLAATFDRAVVRPVLVVVARTSSSQHGAPLALDPFGVFVPPRG